MGEEHWSIQQLAKFAGTTSRTLRHYDAIGLLVPARTAANGYRQYDRAGLVRLQRIMLLRDLGLGLPQIAEILDRQASEEEALEEHLAWLRREKDRLDRQIASVRRTITALRGGGELMAQDMFDGFDHTQYKDEVEQRWGEKAYADGDRWWRGMTADDKSAWQRRAADLGRDWIAAAESGIAPDSPAAAALARRHVEWLASIPGTPASAGDAAEVKAYVIGLGEMYVADERFGAIYATSAGGTAGAEFVRDALRAFAEANL